MIRKNLNEAVVDRIRVLSGIALVISTPFITHATNIYARAERLNSNVVGGEFLVPVVLLFLVLLIIPQKYMTIRINDLRYLEKEVTVIDISSSESYNKNITLENGLFTIIDTDGVNHMIRLSSSEEK